MKKTIIAAVFICCILLTANNTRKVKIKLSDLALLNIEAIAGDEVLGTYDCYGYGDVDCPDGTKAIIVIIKQGLDMPI